MIKRITMKQAIEMQAQWCKEYDISIGSLVLVKDYGICKVVDMKSFGFRVNNGNFDMDRYYTDLEPLEPVYRPFKSVEEYAPFRDRWIKLKGKAMRINAYDNYGVTVGNSGCFASFERAFKESTFDDGTPFGVKE